MNELRKGREAHEFPGYLTVYAALTLTVMISLCLALTEGVRRHTIAFETECVMDIGLDSVLAEYHRVLLERYGLLMVDASYGTDYPSYHITEGHLANYLTRNLSCEDCGILPFLYRDLLAMELKDVQILKVALATDDGGRVFQRRAAECMRSRMGLEAAEKLLEWMETVEGYGLLEEDIEARMDRVSAELQEYEDADRQLGEEEWIRIEIPDPTEAVQALRREGILKWVVEDVSQLSEAATGTDRYISGRSARGEINHGNYPQEEPPGLTDNILLLEYFLNYAGRYGKTREDSLLQYQVEYLLGGNGADIVNLRHTANVLCGIREAANVVYLLQDEGKRAQVEAAAAVLAGVVAQPELQPVFETAMILAWAYLESLYDVKTLLAGGRVELLKKESDWHYSLTGIWAPQREAAPEKGAGLSYEDYLRILLYVQPPELLTMRFMDLMEMDIRRTPGNSCFRMDGCIDRLEAEAVVQSGYGCNVTIRREKAY